MPLQVGPAVWISGSMINNSSISSETGGINNLDFTSNDQSSLGVSFYQIDYSNNYGITFKFIQNAPTTFFLSLSNLEGRRLFLCQFEFFVNTQGVATLKETDLHADLMHCQVNDPNSDNFSITLSDGFSKLGKKHV